MEKLTEATGGRMINVGNKFDKLKEAFDQNLRGTAQPVQHRLYLDQYQARRHVPQIGIKNKQGYKIQTRAGYYATAREPLPQ